MTNQKCPSQASSLDSLDMGPWVQARPWAGRPAPQVRGTLGKERAKARGRARGTAGSSREPGDGPGVSAIIWTVLRLAHRPGLRKSSPIVPTPLPHARPRKKRPSILLHITALENSAGDILSLCPPFSRGVRTHREKQGASRAQSSMLCDSGQAMGLSDSSPLQGL